jgi:lipopolysaccharide export system protein LptA
MHFAKIFKFSFIFIALALTVFLFSQNNAEKERMAISQIDRVDNQFKQASVADVASTTMHSPRFSGEDNKNRRWLISANKAEQSGDMGNEEVFLDTIQAKATKENGEEISFKALEGLYDHKTQTLILQKDITIKGYGFTLSTEQLTASMKRGDIKGEKNVEVTTDRNKLIANSFYIAENAKKITFSGDVTSTQKEMDLSAQKLDIFFKSQDNLDGDSGVDKIVAEEKVTLKSKKDVVTADKATYIPNSEDVVLTGNVIFVKGENVLKGNKLIYNIRTGKTNLSSDNEGEKGRIKLKLVPTGEK